jgi:hypothetical protein
VFLRSEIMNTIKVGKFARAVDVEIRYAWRCTRWDVYPQREPRVLAALILGDVYQRAPSGIWFRSFGLILGAPTPARVLERVSPDALTQIERLVNA